MRGRCLHSCGRRSMQGSASCSLALGVVSACRRSQLRSRVTQALMPAPCTGSVATREGVGGQKGFDAWCVMSRADEPAGRRAWGSTKAASLAHRPRYHSPGSACKLQPGATTYKPSRASQPQHHRRARDFVFAACHNLLYFIVSNPSSASSSRAPARAHCRAPIRAPPTRASSATAPRPRRCEAHRTQPQVGPGRPLHRSSWADPAHPVLGRARRSASASPVDVVIDRVPSLVTLAPYTRSHELDRRPTASPAHFLRAATAFVAAALLKSTFARRGTPSHTIRHVFGATAPAAAGRRRRRHEHLVHVAARRPAP
jgi:hypothetical protein